jgi:hypothetical protein
LLLRKVLEALIRLGSTPRIPLAVSIVLRASQRKGRARLGALRDTALLLSTATKLAACDLRKQNTAVRSRQRAKAISDAGAGAATGRLGTLALHALEGRSAHGVVVASRDGLNTLVVARGTLLLVVAHQGAVQQSCLGVRQGVRINAELEAVRATETVLVEILAGQDESKIAVCVSLASACGVSTLGAEAARILVTVVVVVIIVVVIVRARTRTRTIARARIIVVVILIREGSACACTGDVDVKGSERGS